MTTPKPDSDKSKSLWQFFRESPLVGLEIEFERNKDVSREVHCSISTLITIRFVSPGTDPALISESCG
jgi:hypothetical protein